MKTKEQFYNQLGELKDVFLIKFNLNVIPHFLNIEQRKFIHDRINELQSDVEDEIWFYMPEYGSVEMSDIGRVKYKGNIKKTNITQNGYPNVSIYGKGNGKSKNKTLYIHREIALTYIPPEEHRPHIDHINSVRFDFNPKNLRWVSNIENCRCGNNSNGYKGISFFEKCKRWVVPIGTKGKQCYFGYYEEELDAAYVSDVVTRYFHPTIRTEFLNMVQPVTAKELLKRKAADYVKKFGIKKIPVERNIII